MSNHYQGENVEDDFRPFISFNGNKEFKKTKNLEFDQQSRYLMCYGPN